MTTQNTIIGIIIIVMLALGVWKFYFSPTPQERVDTQEEGTIPEDNASSTEAVVVTEQTANTGSTEEETTKTQAEQSSVQNPTSQFKEEKEELGPRQPAKLPGDALKFFAEAVKVQDIERALSYMRKDVQPQYRTYFEVDYKGELSPVIHSYFFGTVGEVKLVETTYGWYRIEVYPTNSKLPFLVDIEYDSSVGEFVITEL